MPFAKTLLVELAKCYLEARRGLRWKRKYLPLKTGKKLSEKLLCVLLIHLTELQLSLEETFHWDCSCGNFKVLLEATRGLWWKRKYPPLKTAKKLSEKLLYVLLIHLTELQFTLQQPFTEPVLVEFAMRYWKPIEGYGEKGYILR